MFFVFVVATKHPSLTLILCGIVVLALGYGVQNLLITTDPVELWAGPESRSRQEKQYFDSNFGPFYRTSQIFVRPINGTYVRKRSLSHTNTRFNTFHVSLVQAQNFYGDDHIRASVRETISRRSFPSANGNRTNRCEYIVCVGKNLLCTDDPCWQ